MGKCSEKCEIYSRVTGYYRQIGRASCRERV